MNGCCTVNRFSKEHDDEQLSQIIIFKLNKTNYLENNNIDKKKFESFQKTHFYNISFKTIIKSQYLHIIYRKYLNSKFVFLIYLNQIIKDSLKVFFKNIFGRNVEKLSGSINSSN